MPNQSGKTMIIVVVVVAAIIGGYLFLTAGQGGASLKQNATIKAAEVVGKAAKASIASATDGLEGSHGSSVDLINRKIEARWIADNVVMAVGVGNVTMITTDEGNVVFDTGVVIQAAEQRKILLEEVGTDVPATHVIISHSHGDHAGGIKVWLNDDVEVIAHTEFQEELRYLKELETYQHKRNLKFFPWMPDEVADLGPLDWGDATPTITVDETEDYYTFELGGTQFQVISTPGAEGADNVVLWLPEQKILFSGDFFGPQFPQFPNIFTARGEKVRKPVEYIRSLNKIIALKPEMIVPSHFNPTEDADQIMADLVKTRDAVAYVHTAVIEGMNAGKDVYQLMREIDLPPELQLPQNHGRVMWNVRSIWEYYTTWFYQESTTELYPVPSSYVYADVAEIAGKQQLTQRASERQAAGEPVHALHLIEMALGQDKNYAPALEVRKQALTTLLEQAEAGYRNDYEMQWLAYRIKDTETRLTGVSGSDG
jgi:alkyl sulfatase BDS1-like metallo-beta-lactamase superfamily hydrolase